MISILNSVTTAVSESGTTPRADKNEKGTPILEAEFLRKLERLSLSAEHALTSRMQGERRSLRRGASIEFADYREYAAGDDLRYVDWKAYARLERLFVKLFVAEEDLSIHLLVDASESMSYVNEGSSSENTKFAFARKVAAALGYIGLLRYDRVGVTSFAQGGSTIRRVPTLRGRRSIPDLFSYLQNLRPGGRGDFTTALQDYARRAQTTGVCVIISDFLDENWEKGVKALLSRRFKVVLLQVLSPEEIDPSLTGDLHLIDAETGASREISMTPQLLSRYKVALESFCGRLSDAAAKYGMDYMQTTTETPLEELLLTTLRKSGLLRG